MSFSDRQKTIHNMACGILTGSSLPKTTTSKATIRAKAFTVLWQLNFRLEGTGGIKSEYPVAGLNERFDLVDTLERTVYEL